NVFAWHNSFILFSEGFFSGPRAIGASMIFSSIPTVILTLLNFYRYAQVTSFKRFEFFTSSYSFLPCCFLLCLDALFHYVEATILFQTDSDGIDQTADLFHWIDDTFRNGKWKPILGLFVMYFYYISLLLVNAYIVFKIRYTQR
ncbi:hypothetical protein PMAYCL1PPCAC_15478, partial [Pristionchus mayeri]